MKRRDFIAATTGAVIGAGATYGVVTNKKNTGTQKTVMQAPAVNKGLLEWRMVTTWPKTFPGLGTGANLLGELITRGSGGRLTVKVFGA